MKPYKVILCGGPKLDPKDQLGMASEREEGWKYFTPKQKGVVNLKCRKSPELKEQSLKTMNANAVNLNSSLKAAIGEGQ